MENTYKLSEREQQILHAVVHHYITTAEPVGSRAVTRRFELGVSPATVRNTMADLEEMGLLEQPHTSSGRVPTDTGYRYYVDHLMQVQELTLGERAQIESEFSERLNSVDDVLRQTSHLLALVTHQAGLAEAPCEHAAEVRRIELMPLGPRRLAVLIADNMGRVQTVAAETDDPLTEDQLLALTRFLNEQLRGTTLDRMAALLDQRLRHFLDRQRQLAEQALRVLTALPHERPAQLYLEGASHLFEQPEFQDIARARQVFGLFDERAQLLEMLRQAANSHATHSMVVLGSETPGEGLEGMGLVASSYRVNGEEAGMIGVLGPRRMPYPRLAAVVDYTAEILGRFLSRLGR